MVITVSLLFIFIFFSILEYFFAFKKYTHSNKHINLSLFFINFIFLKLLFPLSVYSLSTFFSIDFITFDSLLLTIFIFDFAIYWQHRLFHRFSFLWKFHCIHHSDRQLNITSGLRFHFGELIISNFYKSSLIVLLSINFEYYLIYETFLTGFSLFNHSNIKINNKIEYLLSFVIVTPKVHRTHHSVEHTLMNSNFGNLFVFWDKFFKTFSTAVCQKMGLTSFPDDNNLKKLLMSPFT